MSCLGSLVRNQPKTKGVARNCWRHHLQEFEMMNADEQLRTVCEEAGFIRTVSEGMYYRTGEDVNDGFRNLIASCRDYTLSRTHRDSEVNFWILKKILIGQVCDVKIICQTSDTDYHLWPTQPIVRRSETVPAIRVKSPPP